MLGAPKEAEDVERPFSEEENAKLVELVDHYVKEKGYSASGLILFRTIAPLVRGFVIDNLYL
jgi:hypothetical protein